ncbi:hypothetical protein BDV32DRAFT_128967 [Aspergillus pseudonomiae]|nr:hypothetical protein BDV32DRAFT_128967 [Aspergillus pseudonomiae]
MASLNDGVLPLEVEALNRQNDELNGKCVMQLISYSWLVFIYMILKRILRFFGAILSLEMKCDPARRSALLDFIHC